MTKKADDTHKAVSFTETDDKGGDAPLRTNEAFKGRFHQKS